MIVEDRTKQTATVVDIDGGTYNIQMYGGAAAAGHFPFMRSFFKYVFDDPMAFAVARTLHNIPVLIENGSEWLLTTGKLELLSATNLMLRVPTALDNPVKSSAGWSFALATDVTVSVPVSAHAASGLHVKQNNIFPTSATDPLRELFLESLNPARHGIGGGAVAIGGGEAFGQDAVAIGISAYASGKNSVAIGKNVTAGRVGGIVLGLGVGAINSGAFARGFTGYPLGAVDMWSQIMDGQFHANTTDATPTNLKAYDESGVAIANSEWTYCDPGITHVKAIVSAVNTANNDSKVWELAFALKNINAWGGLAMMGSLSKTVVAADAGAAAWDVGIDVVPANDEFAFTATGEVGKNIIWTVSYVMSMHSFYA